MEIHLPPGLRQAVPGDAELPAEITADAFRADPFNEWLFGGQEPMRRTFRTLAHWVYLPRGICHLSEDVGAAMWLPPEASKGLPVFATPRLVIDLLATTELDALRRIVRADREMRLRKPSRRHLYLFTVGVRDSARGTGLGRRLLAPALDAADRAGLPTYLESSNPANHGFYASIGFERLAVFDPVENSPPVETMWREPRPSSGDDGVAV